MIIYYCLDKENVISLIVLMYVNGLSPSLLFSFDHRSFIAMADKEETPKEKEERIQGYVTFNAGRRFGEWTIEKKLDEGGFGKVYLVRRKDGQTAALKAEPNEVEGGSAIKLEKNVLRDLNVKGEMPHIPVLYHAAKHRNFCYMVMTLLGDNLKALRNQQPQKNGYSTFTVSTWIRLGIQCLYSLKVIHDHGFLHRDIKPNNFLMGHSSDPERSRIVYLLDFGLSRSYAFKSANGKWICRMARPTAEFRGTVRYCSPNVHNEVEQGRRDDIWSMFYVLIELHCGLPWQTINSKEKIEWIKCRIKDEHLTQNIPHELRSVIPALRRLDCYHRPDYHGIYQSMIAVQKRYKVSNDEPFDWEKAKGFKIFHRNIIFNFHPSKMVSTTASQLQNYLAKLDDPSQTRKFLQKIYELRLTNDIIFEYGADLVLNTWTSHGTHGYLARRILEKWSRDEVTASSSSNSNSFSNSHSSPNSNSSSDESSAPAPTAPTRKRAARHILYHMNSTKKYKLDSDYEETDEEYADEYELAVDEIIRRNLENRAVEYPCVHSFIKSSDWQNCKRMAARKSS
ncbi:hypothetical protein PRIPAC_86996 [Pristionchus pacificus]|uniref:non-specific serine/threonine protein kinase n=1 Tax=Pristionchus pacificus TaxID=54126 RepID=A0A2A6BKK6_PRIPA|nr:hypothetical protein PRIPAC_86996 [Pristionchus pacificus]|eukprot:PDM66445.1 protein kinase [Pristionchus pacificus]